MNRPYSEATTGGQMDEALRVATRRLRGYATAPRGELALTPAQAAIRVLDALAAAGLLLPEGAETRRLKVMVDGWFALAELDKHATSAGMPFVPFGGEAEPWCLDCSRFASALLRGEKPTDALHLRCAPAQEWQRLVDAATEIAKAVRLAVGDSKPTGQDPSVSVEETPQ